MRLSKLLLPCTWQLLAATAALQAQNPPPHDLVITDATVMTVTHGTRSAYNKGGVGARPAERRHAKHGPGSGPSWQTEPRTPSPA